MDPSRIAGIDTSSFAIPTEPQAGLLLDRWRLPVHVTPERQRASNPHLRSPIRLVSAPLVPTLTAVRPRGIERTTAACLPPKRYRHGPARPLTAFGPSLSSPHPAVFHPYAPIDRTGASHRTFHFEQVPKTSTSERLDTVALAPGHPELPAATRTSYTCSHSCCHGGRTDCHPRS